MLCAVHRASQLHYRASRPTVTGCPPIPEWNIIQGQSYACTIVSIAHLIEQHMPERPLLPWMDIQAHTRPGRGRLSFKDTIDDIKSFCASTVTIRSRGISASDKHPSYESGVPKRGEDYVPSETYGWVKDVPISFAKGEDAARIADILLTNNIPVAYETQGHAKCVYFDRTFSIQASDTACVLTSSGGKRQKPNGTWQLLSPMYKTKKSDVVKSCRNWEVAYMNDATVIQLLEDALMQTTDASSDDLNTYDFLDSLGLTGQYAVVESNPGRTEAWLTESGLDGQFRPTKRARGA